QIDSSPTGPTAAPPPLITAPLAPAVTVFPLNPPMMIGDRTSGLICKAPVLPAISCSVLLSVVPSTDGLIPNALPPCTNALAGPVLSLPHVHALPFHFGI